MRLSPRPTLFHTQGTRPRALAHAGHGPGSLQLVWKPLARDTSVSKALVGELARADGAPASTPDTRKEV